MKLPSNKPALLKKPSPFKDSNTIFDRFETGNQSLSLKKYNLKKKQNYSWI